MSCTLYFQGVQGLQLPQISIHTCGHLIGQVFVRVRVDISGYVHVYGTMASDHDLMLNPWGCNPKLYKTLKCTRYINVYMCAIT